MAGSAEILKLYNNAAGSNDLDSVGLLPRHAAFLLTVTQVYVLQARHPSPTHYIVNAVISQRSALMILKPYDSITLPMKAVGAGIQEWTWREGVASHEREVMKSGVAMEIWRSTPCVRMLQRFDVV